MGADASPLLILQTSHRDSAEEQQQQLWCYSGYLSSQDGRGGYRGSSSSASVSLQGLAAGGPDISEWWQVTWKDKTCLCTAVYKGLPREFLLGFMCVVYVQNTWSPVSTLYMNILHMFKVSLCIVVYAAISTFPQAASSPSPCSYCFPTFPKMLWYRNEKLCKRLGSDLLAVWAVVKWYVWPLNIDYNHV